MLKFRNSISAFVTDHSFAMQNVGEGWKVFSRSRRLSAAFVGCLILIYSVLMHAELVYAQQNSIVKSTVNKVENNIEKEFKVDSLLELSPAKPLKPAVARGEFRCPADNPAWWQEAQEGGWEGYGETWDLHTCEEEGGQFFFPGTYRRWRPYRKPIVLNVRPSGKPVDVQFYSVLLPVVAFGSIGMVALFAWVLAMITRKKKLALVDVSCPVCDLIIPIAVDEKKEKTSFCPGCGGASFTVVGHGKRAVVEVHILNEGASKIG